MKRSLVASKSYDFALDIVRLYKYLSFEKKEYILSKQLLRSGTSIGALIREAEHAQSKRDFLHKMNMALKEANESVYWIDLLKDSSYMPEDRYMPFSEKSNELVRILISIVKTTKMHLDIR